MRASHTKQRQGELKVAGARWSFQQVSHFELAAPNFCVLLQLIRTMPLGLENDAMILLRPRQLMAIA